MLTTSPNVHVLFVYIFQKAPNFCMRRHPCSGREANLCNDWLVSFAGKGRNGLTAVVSSQRIRACVRNRCGERRKKKKISTSKPSSDFSHSSWGNPTGTRQGAGEAGMVARTESTQIGSLLTR